MNTDSLNKPDSMAEDDELDKILDNFAAITLASTLRYAKKTTIAHLEAYIDTEITKGLLKNPSKLRIGMLRQALNEDRITDPNKMVDNAYLEHWLGIAELKLKGEKE